MIFSKNQHFLWNLIPNRQIYILWCIFFPKIYTLIYAMVKVQKLTVVDKFQKLTPLLRSFKFTNSSSLSFNVHWNRNTVLFISTLEILKVCDRRRLGKTITVANEEGKHNRGVGGGAIIWLFYCICVIWIHFSGQKLETFEGLMCVISEYQSIGWKNFSPYNFFFFCASSEHLDFMIKRELHPWPKISMFCALSQNHQHLIEKWYMHPRT